MAHIGERAKADRKRKRKSSSEDDGSLSTSFQRPAKRSRKGEADGKRKKQSGSQRSQDDGRPSTSRPAQRSRRGRSRSSRAASTRTAGKAGRKRKRQSSSEDDGSPSTSFKRPAKRPRKEAYEKGPLLGQGGFGSVYAGIRLSDGLPVAIKYVSKDRTRRRLKVEGQGLLPLEVALMTRVSSAPACPNVLQLVEWFDHRSHYSLILERPVPCQDLQSFCEENGCVDESLAKKVLVQLITALKHCESRGVLHRDVKPENLLISTASHDIKLLDFGCGDLLKDSAYTYFAG
ncbi:serine/threonine-protein kinase pim-3-like [Pimephales promelas]|nr:serine/threonine-protein kinase pim-3-like [Pimephales promelas]